MSGTVTDYFGFSEVKSDPFGARRSNPKRKVFNPMNSSDSSSEEESTWTGIGASVTSFAGSIQMGIVSHLHGEKIENEGKQPSPLHSSAPERQLPPSSPQVLEPPPPPSTPPSPSFLLAGDGGCVKEVDEPCPYTKEEDIPEESTESKPCTHSVEIQLFGSEMLAKIFEQDGEKAALVQTQAMIKRLFTCFCDDCHEAFTFVVTQHTALQERQPALEKRSVIASEKEEEGVKGGDVVL